MSSSYVAPRSSTEERLARIWSESLKVETIGVNDDFFDLNGQSLLAVSLFTEIEKEFNRRLPLSTLLEAPTIEALARVLDDCDEKPAGWPSLVPLQPDGDRRPLYLVHGAGGNVLLYRCLAEHLSPDYPVYGLQSQGLDGASHPLATVEEMAARYLREVREVQPKGPYYLGGYCLGGTIAYEMAQLLHRDGEEVALLAMLDTYNYSVVSQSRFTGFLFQKVKFHLGNFVRLRPGNMVKYVREKARIARDGRVASGARRAQS